MWVIRWSTASCLTSTDLIPWLCILSIMLIIYSMVVSIYPTVSITLPTSDLEAAGSRTEGRRVPFDHVAPGPTTVK
jgi:hypothetical protein